MQGELSRTIAKKLSGRIFKIFLQKDILYVADREKNTHYWGWHPSELGIRIKRPMPTCHGPLAVVGDHLSKAKR